MTTRAQVLELLGEGHSYERAGRELGIAAGQAYMIATGLPADGSETPSPEQPAAGPMEPGSPQRLVNPPAVNPTRNQRVIEWVAERAARELSRPER